MVDALVLQFEIIGLIPCHFIFECNSGQLVHTHLPMLPHSIIWYQQKVRGEQAHHVTRVRVPAASAGVWLRKQRSSPLCEPLALLPDY